MSRISGIHHVTAISSDAQSNVAFYTTVLGLRLVKRTVNFDDPGSYHLYYGDLVGSPGTILTFFAWPGAAPGEAGAGAPTAVAFSIPPGSHEWWKTRLQNAGIAPQDPSARFGEPVLRFSDPDNIKVELIETARAHANELRFWAQGPIPAEYAIRGVHSVTLEHSSGHTTPSFAPDLGFRAINLGDDDSAVPRQRFAITEPGMARYVDVVPASASRRSHMGAGTIHHIAFRTNDEASQLAWRQKLLKDGYHVTQVMDRSYFQSIYFRERGGVLFEIATDGPGFTVDESEATLGEALKLPKQYEHLRSKLEASLPPLWPARAIALQDIR